MSHSLLIFIPKHLCFFEQHSYMFRWIVKFNIGIVELIKKELQFSEVCHSFCQAFVVIDSHCHWSV